MYLSTALSPLRAWEAENRYVFSPWDSTRSRSPGYRSKQEGLCVEVILLRQESGIFSFRAESPLIVKYEFAPVAIPRLIATKSPRGLVPFLLVNCNPAIVPQFLR